MDCRTARELSLEAVVAGRPTPEEADRHVRECGACREELRDLGAVWAALEALPLAAPSEAAGRRLRRRVVWASVRETVGSIESWQRAALVGVAGFIVSVLLAWLVPYQTMVALCERLLADGLPAVAAYMLAGLLYGLIPMSVGLVLPWRPATPGWGVAWLEAVVVLLVVMLPYVVLRCAEFPLVLLAGFVGGIALGAVIACVMGSGVRRRHAWS